MSTPSFNPINTYRVSSSNPRLGTSTDKIRVSPNNVRPTKIVDLGTITVNGYQVQLFDVFTAQGKFTTTDIGGVCTLTFGEFPLCP